MSIAIIALTKPESGVADHHAVNLGVTLHSGERKSCSLNADA